MATVEVQHPCTALDHEGVDLGVVIGMKGEDSPQDLAKDHVDGYALAFDMVATEPQAVAKDNDVLQHPHKQLYRTAFHYQPAKNWMNAPLYYKEYYHLFYQYNPHGPVWGNLTWAHAVSKDLVHWLYLEDVLKPDQWYDVMGVWSGSATIDPDGIPFILYTGLIEHTHEQVQCMAVPADPSDPLLREWVKVPQNPILKRPPSVGLHDFRDPSTAWQQSDGTWIFTVGAKVGDIGLALQYRSTDLKNWEFLEDKLLHSGPAVGMWECVDFFPVDYDTPTHSDTQKYVFKISLYDVHIDYYTIGTYDEAAHKFIPDHQELDIGIGFHLDYGKYYASKSFFDPVKKRRIMWAWVPESCTQEMDLQKGWSSLQGIPRTIALDSKTGVNLIQWPIEEIESLRGHKLSQTDVKLDAGAVVKVKGAGGSQLDVEVVFEYPDVSNVEFTDEAKLDDAFNCSQGGYEHHGVFGPFGLLVLTDENFQEQTAVYFYIARSTDGKWTTRFCNDQSRSSLLPGVEKLVYGSYVKILPTEDFLALRVLVDRSIVESFVQHGRMVVTSRVYPSVAVDDLANLYLFNNGMTPITVRSIDAYTMKPARFSGDLRKWCVGV
ncbi:unnamed protein product [Sphagnum jensenii]|uniref:Uncharacterized protein n=1 Tax=Sphagnum jensenii TaxID=128206 RepID=A0ABP0ZY35_9BRYO